ncbi:MAG: hypothetical protein ACR650_17960 [Methylocystis sp.]|jgi:hypothetical protein
MKTRVISGAALATAAISLALVASPAAAKHKSHHAPKATAEKNSCSAKSACSAKNGCSAKAGEDKAAAPAGDKPAEAK